MTINLDALEKLPPLKSGGHEPGTDMCVMEAVAFVAGEPWSDMPACVSPVIGAFLRNWNDNLPSDADRDRLLKPLIAKIINTRASKAIEERRSYMALDWMIGTYLPAWLRLAKLEEQADKVAALAPIVDMATATAAASVVRDANQKAAAAWAAAGDAAGDAAWAAAGDAAWAAAGDAAWAAAWAAAGDAAGDAAWAAARAALSTTRDQLQLSAVELVERMAVLSEGTAQ